MKKPRRPITSRSPRSGRKGVGLPTGLLTGGTKHGNKDRIGSMGGKGRKGTYKP